MGQSGQNTKQNMDENDIIKQFMEMLSQHDMGGQSQDFMELFKYAVGMQLQIGAMANELQGMREQLAQLQDSQPKAATEKLMDKAAHIQEKLADLSQRLSEIKDCFVETAAKAVNAFKEKGKEEMCKVLQKGISSIKSLLAGYQEQMIDVKTDYQKTANQIDSIGDQLKQIGNSVSNVGRLLAGKGTKEMSDEQPGIGITRAINTPVKNAIAHLQKNIDAIDRMTGKLDSLSERLNTAKEAEKGGRTSLKDKLSQMKEKAGQQNRPEPDKEKGKNRAECL
ncbi:MAG: hypothetical protein HDQ98_11785 [Lachnospiraceae bacterium]|nr:hypothetical protein [Lachnospiraceae bacterium]